MTFRNGNRGTVAARGAGVIAVVAALVLLAPTAAHADGIDWTTSSTTVEYGEYWVANATLAEPEYTCILGYSSCGTAGATTYTGTSSGSFSTWVLQANTGFDYALGGTATGPLSIGGYQFSIVYDRGFYMMPPASTTTPFALTVVPAAISTDLRITTDPASDSGAVVSIALAGRYVDEATFGGPALPDGTWDVQVTDADGQEVFTATLAQSAGTASSANFYWSDVPAETTFSATGTFTPSTGASNFSVEPGAASFTSPAPLAEPAPPAEADEEVAPDGSLASAPVWLLILGGLLFLGSVVTATILMVRDARSRRATESPSVETPESESEPEAIHVP